MKTILDFAKAKIESQPITMLTCYDYAMACALNETSIDCLLVGDSVAMVMHGYDSTVNATIEMMVLHTQAVRRGAKDKFIVADMPFLSFRSGLPEAVKSAGQLIRAGADAVKLEGVKGHEDVVRHLTQSGIPVMGHLGLTPQSYLTLGGYRVQGKESGKAKEILTDAMDLERLGAFSLVLECVPASLASDITDSLKIPTIGIGAGQAVDGQVLVTHDMLGLQNKINPKFVRRFSNLEKAIVDSVEKFVETTKKREFPSTQETYL